MPPSTDFLVVGAGIFGITTAVELHKRGYSVAVIDPGPIPHPLAASTDVSKVVRMEYGTDRQYAAMVDQAIDGFLAWNEEFGAELYHNTGVLMLAKEPFRPGHYVADSYYTLLDEGHKLERVSSDDLRRRFPAWNADVYVDGFYGPRGGYAESGRFVEEVTKKAVREGVQVYAGQTAAELLGDQGRITGVRTRQGEIFQANQTIVAAGAWTHILLPELKSVMKATGHPVFHLKPDNPALFTPPQFTVFTADVARTGWYGFPLHPQAGIVKVANHGVGVVLHPEHDERVVYDHDIQRMRAFLAETFPALANAELVYTRRCLYNDTGDEHFWIDRHPERQGLSVAAGGSGHGFKFAPVLGPLIADIVEGKPNRWAAKFAWRELQADSHGEEASRYHGNTPPPDEASESRWPDPS
jgi:glycine/D-amino acid oxidase-like deaminating enzyme